MRRKQTLRLVVALALVTTTAPAAASDFRGVLTFFFGTPLLVLAAALLGLMLLRRVAAAEAANIRLAAAGCLLIMASAAAWVATFALAFAGRAMFGPLLGLPIALSWGIWLWRHPRGRLASISPHLALALVCVSVAAVVWDFNALLSGSSPVAHPLMLLPPALALLCVGLYWQVLRRRERGLALGTN
ncbi:MAG TPA: hypothetical protein VD865_04395 [Stenotrophomonas sp.]|nr:hypothetical protein [Stenotrophomonas sp.]